MKKLSFLLAAVLIFTTVNAKIRRVGFFASPISGTDYTTFALAYTAASAGDTILMFPNTTLGGTLTKKLIILGPGNFLDPNTTPKGNANLQAFPGEAVISSLTIAPGSDGSVVEGFHSGSIYVTTDNISLIRNRDINVVIAYTSPPTTITNLQVLQNYNVSVSNYYSNSCGVTNMNISNNLMYSFSILVGNAYSGNISNNVWTSDATLSAALNGGSSTQSLAVGIDLGNGSNSPASICDMPAGL